MARPKFAVGEFYHVYNRGTEKRSIFRSQEDLDRFLQSMTEFNCMRPIGSIYESSFLKEGIRKKRQQKKLLNIICYCLNHNHYHLVLEQLVDGGISEFMRRVGTGYTQYFNLQNKRNGVLFQGKFKATYINSNEYLLHVSAYVNLNHKIHSLGNRIAKSSWGEYMGEKQAAICSKDIVLNQFKNNKEYEEFALSSLIDIQERKKQEKDLEKLLLE